MFEAAALLYAAVCLATIVFQVCLIAGAPWGRLTQGGAHDGPLPVGGRLFAGLSIVLLAAMALSIASAAGLWPGWPRWVVWPALALQLSTTALNWITPSAPERRLWSPIMSLTAALALYVVFGA